MDWLVLWPWPFLTHPTAKYISAGFVAAPLAAQADVKTWWWIAFGVSVAHVLWSDLVVCAKRRREQSDVAAEILAVGSEISHALTVIRRRVAPSASLRLTIMLPRKVGDGAWELVPALRSDGIPTEDSRALRVFPNRESECEGVAGLLFGKDIGMLERCRRVSDNDYGQQMQVTQVFVDAANEFAGTRRNPCYVLAFMLRFNNCRMGVLTIDSEQAMNLTGSTEDLGDWRDLKPKPKGHHSLRRSGFEAVADIMPRLSLARLFTLSGINP